MKRLVAVWPIRTSIGMIAEGEVFDAPDKDAEKMIAKGVAQIDDGVRRWRGIDWLDSHVVILASGPSLTDDQLALVHEWRNEAVEQPRRVIVINLTFKNAPWADVLYACDERWWKKYHDEAKLVFQGKFWSCDFEPKPNTVNTIGSSRSPGLSKQYGVINIGSNSGLQAIGLAHQAGAKRIVLLGYDMKRGDNGEIHHHDDYPVGLKTEPTFNGWMAQFDPLAKDLKAAGIEVINATPGTALRCFDEAPLEKALWPDR